MNTRRIAPFLVLATLAPSAGGQPANQALQVTDPAAIGVLRSLNARIDALGRLATQCAEKKLAPPELCFCRYPNEVDAVRREYQAAIRAYPAWATRAVTWTDASSGSAMGHTIAMPHLGPQLGKCPAK